MTAFSPWSGAGAQFAVIASNTPHLVFDQVQERSPLPLISIVKATQERALALGLQRPGLLGTLTTMGSDLYQRAFAPHGLEVAVPPPEDQALIQQRLDNEIELGIIKQSTRQELLDIVARLQQARDIDSVILGLHRAAPDPHSRRVGDHLPEHRGHPCGRHRGLLPRLA